MSLKNRKILVTGAAGFLGSHLSEKLSIMGHNVIGIDNMLGGYDDNVPKNIEFHKIDCCDLDKIKNIMKGVDVVYHCAATHEGQFFHHEITKIIILPLFQFFPQQLMKKSKELLLFLNS